MKKNWPTLLIVFVFTLAVYLIFCQKEFEIRHYFLPLANSFLHGRIDITPAGPLNELVTVAGKSYVVYPPMPAVALIPFAAVFGMKISQVYPTVIFAALSGAIFLLVLSKLTSRRHALALSALLLFGTNFFLTSMMGRSWYFAHICAVLFLAISLYFAQNRKPYLAGFFLVAAGLSRLPVFLAFPAVLYFLKPKPKD